MKTRTEGTKHLKTPLSLAALTCLSVCLTSRSAELTFQQGRHGYTGTQDVTLRGDPPAIATSNCGGTATLDVSGVPWGGWKQITLIRFGQLVGPSANQIPAGATVVSARLELHKIADAPRDDGQYQGAEAKTGISVGPMLTEFQAGTGDGSKPVEKAACFAYRAYSAELPVFWGNHNQIENGPVPDVDYNSKIWVTIPFRPGASNIWQSCDVTGMVREWVQQSGGNRGLYLRANSSWVGATFDSSKSTNGSNRPRLIVEFTPPAR